MPSEDTSAPQPTESLAWVQKIETIDAIDPTSRTFADNPGWRLLHVGTGSGGQTTLTFAWPAPEVGQ